MASDDPEFEEKAADIIGAAGDLISKFSEENQ
jgi:hypothetical protein